MEAIAQNYRSIETSSDESDSEDSSSSSISSTTSSLASDIDDSSDSSSSSSKRCREKRINKPDKVRNKVKKDDIQSELSNLPPIENLHITVPENSCELFGQVSSIVSPVVIVKPKPNMPTLNISTVLFLDKGQQPLGEIYDVFGSPNDSYYCVRFNSSEHIEESGVKVDMEVYYCPNTPYTFLLFPQELMKIKGYDIAADEDNGEPPDFSDDEEEQAYYEELRRQQKKKQEKYCTKNSGGNTRQLTKQMFTPGNPRNTNVRLPNEAKKGWRSSHPWNRSRKRTWESSDSAQDAPAQCLQHQFDATWSSYDPRNTFPMYHGSHVRYGAPFNVPQAYEFPRVPIVRPSRFHSAVPPVNQFPGTPFPRMNMPFPERPFVPMYANPPWPPVSFRPPHPSYFSPPPPPPPPTQSPSCPASLTTNK